MNPTTTSVTIRAYPNKRAGNHIRGSHFRVSKAGEIESGSEVVANKVISGVSGYSLTDSDPWVAVYTRGSDAEGRPVKQSTVTGIGGGLQSGDLYVIESQVDKFKANLSEANQTFIDDASNYTSYTYNIVSGNTEGEVFSDLAGNANAASEQFSFTYDGTSPSITTSNIVSSISDGGTALGSVTADESVTWSVAGSGISISASGIISLDTAADYLSSASHSFVISATDGVGNESSTDAITVVVIDTTSPVINTSALLTVVNEE